MGFWDFLAQGVAFFLPQVRYYGTIEQVADEVGQMSPAKMYRTQPALRTVTSFLGRNVAQLGVHVFDQAGENDRRRVRDGVADLLRTKPNPTTTAYRMIYALVVDKLLYDVAYWHIREGVQGVAVYRIPPAWVSPVPRDMYTRDHYVVTGQGGRRVTIPVEDIVVFDGYHPTSILLQSAPVEALKDVLVEQIEAAKYRTQVWRRGGRVSSIIERPKDAARWSDAAREAFREDWYAKYTGGGSRAGGTPILEDGMTLKQIGFSAHEQEWAEGLKLSLAQVASAYHVNPTMVGLLDNANFANVREFRKMLYGETLGPLIRDLEDTFNAFLLPRLNQPSTMYAEFNIAEKLQGNFEEQAAVTSTSVGAPWMSRNEARSRFNLPRVEGGDLLVTPLNVLVGGQASPRDAGEQNRTSAPANMVKAHPTVPKLAEILRSHFRRQRSVVLSRMGAKAPWWDGVRFDRELATDLLKGQLLTATSAARAALDDAGTNPDSYDEDRTVAYLKVRAKSDAARINAHTEQAIIDALDDPSGDEDDSDAVDRIFDTAENSGAERIAAGMATAVAAWGVGEAGRQSGASTKTWRVMSGNPRSSHAVLDGETVPIGEAFSNGLMWPGDGSDADEVANCRCEMTINLQ